MKGITDIDGTVYLAGSAGGLILACPKCGAESFRDFRDYCTLEWTREECEKPMKDRRAAMVRTQPLQESCWGPQDCDGTRVPIRMDELETKWKPFWRRLGYWVAGEPLSESP